MTKPGEAQKDAGFTVLEGLVALTFLVIGVTTLLPTLTNPRQGLAVQTAALQLVSSLKTTRAAAMATGREQHFVLDAASRLYFAKGVVAPRPIPEAIAMTFDLRLPGDVQGSYAMIRFYPDGSATGGAIDLRSGRETASVSVDYLTGRSRIASPR
jgi:general secretion pathway protein H